jgi:hypothetical protein
MEPDYSGSCPKIVFIVPYRDRNEHKTFFTTYIHHIMEDYPRSSWDYFFVHQKDSRPFNRGAMKNIGFLAMKYRYPNDYKNITFVFNDVDTLPYTKNVLPYDTEFGVVKHYYGFYFALGGIFSIKGGDFELTNGFPNFWAWGGEDNYMQDRVISTGLRIDRSTFYTIGSSAILQMVDGFKRLICRSEAATLMTKDNIDGIKTIKNLNYNMHSDMIDVYTFDALYSCDQLHMEEQDIRESSRIAIPNHMISKRNHQTQHPQHHLHDVQFKTRPVSHQQYQHQYQQHQHQPRHPPSQHPASTPVHPQRNFDTMMPFHNRNGNMRQLFSINK